MPPQTPNSDDSKAYAPPPGSKFDFILNSGKKPKKQLFSKLSNIPRSIKILVITIVVLFGLLTIPSIFSGNDKEATNQLLRLAGRQQEIIRVTEIAKPLLQTVDTVNLGATTTITITSDQATLGNYLSLNKIKVDPKLLSVYTDKTTDTQLSTAHQNNQIDQAYTDYLVKQLTAYRADMETAFPKAGPVAKQIITDSSDNAGLILEALSTK